MTRRITTDRPRHVYSTEAIDAVRAAHSAGIEISDAVALTVASWWQDPRDGAAFADLSTTGSVDVDDLSRAIGLAYPLAQHDDDRLALDMLGTWAINHA